MTSDTILAFKTFAEKLPKEKRDKVAFVLHTQPVDNNGTDLPAVVQELCPDLNIIFSTQKLSNQHLNYLQHSRCHNQYSIQRGIRIRNL